MPIEEYDATLTTPAPPGQAPPVRLLREFVWGAAYPEPVAMIDHTDAGSVPATGRVTAEYPDGAPPEVLHYLHDALGSVVALTDAAGEVVERYTYDPYGRTYIESPAGAVLGDSAYGNSWMWTGQRYDAVTGQYHFWARTYSPSLGRWLQRDPLGYVDGVNLYEYVASDPIGFADPSGLFVDTICDVGVTIYDAGVTVKNAAESVYGVAAVVYYDVVDDESGMARAYDGLVSDASELGWAATDLAVDGVSAAVPFLPAGASKAARYADDAVDAVRATDDAVDAARAADKAADAVKCGKAADAPTGGTYKLRDPETGQVRRTGRTNDLARRKGELARDSDTKGLEFEIDRRTDVYNQQRGREQITYDQHPEADLNKINPVCPKNPNRQQYMEAAKDLN